MSYKEYKELYQRAQRLGQYHLFVYDIVNSRINLSRRRKRKNNQINF